MTYLGTRWETGGEGQVNGQNFDDRLAERWEGTDERQVNGSGEWVNHVCMSGESWVWKTEWYEIVGVKELMGRVAGPVERWG